MLGALLRSGGSGRCFLAGVTCPGMGTAFVPRDAAVAQPKVGSFPIATYCAVQAGPCSSDNETSVDYALCAVGLGWAAWASKCNGWWLERGGGFGRVVELSLDRSRYQVGGYVLVPW